MSIATINSNDTFIAKHAKNSMKNIDAALQKEASGLKSNNPGELVTENAIKTSLERIISSSTTSRENLLQGADMLDYSHATTSATLKATKRLTDLLQMYLSPTITSKNRDAIQVELDSLVKTIESNGNSTYNGMRLLDGSFSGQKSLSTMQQEKIVSYDMTSVDQYSSYNRIKENHLIQNGSTVKAVDFMGLAPGKAEIDLTGIQSAGKDGSQIIIGKTILTATDVAPANADQFLIGADDEETVRNLVKSLNTSASDEVGKAFYRADAEKLHVEYAQPGSIGEHLLVDVRISGGSNNHVYDLKDATDVRDRAILKVIFDDGANYSADQKIMLNSQTFTFKAAADVSLESDVEIGGDLKESFQNLFDRIVQSNGSANDATYKYDETEGKLSIRTRYAGVRGNEFSFNFAVDGVGAEYSVADLATGVTPTDTENLEASISSVIDRSVLADGENPVVGTKTSEHESTYDSQMVGVIKSLSAVFIDGNPKTEDTAIPNANDDKFDPNMVQFKAIVNDNVYQTNTIALSGGNKTAKNLDGEGYQGLGNHIAGGTALIFQKVGGNNTDAGFELTIKEGGVTLERKDSVEAVQSELTKIVSDAALALEKSEVKLGIAAPSKEINNVGLNDIRSFSASGSVSSSSVLTGEIEIADKIGSAQAQGTFEILINPTKGDFVYMGDKRITVGEDFIIGGDIKETRNNLLTYLSDSKDSEITKAIYTAGLTDGLILITAKRPGAEANQLSFGSKSDTADSVAMNGFTVNSTTSSFRKLGDDVTKPDVVKGTNLHVRVPQFDHSLQGNISNVKAEFIEGMAPDKLGKVFVPNSVKFSAEIGGKTYTGEVALSGGKILPGAKGTPIGNNYNKLGNFLSGGTKIELSSEDGSTAVILEVAQKGFTADGQSLSSVNRGLGQLANIMEFDLSQVHINQTRQVTNFDETKVTGTVLAGLRADSVMISGHNFDASGDVGKISAFKVEPNKNKISLTIGGAMYSQELSANEANGGLGAKYDTKNKVIRGGMYTTITLVTKADIQDDRKLMLNLQGISDVDMSTPEKAHRLESALNTAFGLNSGTGMLSFQAGPSPEDIVEARIQSITPDTMFRDEHGNKVELLLGDKQDVPPMVKVAEEAINYLNIQLTNLGSIRAQFNQRVENIDEVASAIQNSVDNLSNVDVYHAAAEQARASLQTQAAMSAFVHSTSIKRNIAMSVLGA